MISRLTIRHRLWLLVGVALAAIALQLVVSLGEQYERTLQERRQKTQSLVEGATTLVRHYGELATRGAMSDADAREAAKAALRAIRYDGDNYFFVLDGAHRVLLHPTRPELEGKDMSGTKDANGVALYVELVKSAKESRGRFVDYVWAKTGSAQPVEKISLAHYYAPWDWVIGTGIYVDDAAADYRAGIVANLIVFAIAAVMLLVVAWRILISILTPLAQIQDLAGKIADGDLSSPMVAVEGKDEIASLVRSGQTMQQGLRELVSALQESSHELATMSGQMAATTSQLSKSSEEQADSASAMAASMEEISVSVSQVSDHAQEVRETAGRSGALASEGRRTIEALVQSDRTASRAVEQAADKIKELGTLSDRISTIVAVIREVADQTNLLALNAAIEAARAGEQGRGFAVVADEVRKLAERTANSTTDIATMIEQIQSGARGAVSSMEGVVAEMAGLARLSEEAGESIGKIEKESSSVLAIVADINDALVEQTSATTDTAKRVEAIAQMSEENSAAVNQTAAVAEQLRTVAEGLRASAMRFRLA